MGRLLAAVRAIKTWQAIGIVVLLAAAGAGGWAGYRTWGGSNASSVRVDEDLVPVRIGDLVNSVSVNGSLRFSDRQILGFSTNGVVSDVRVAAGATVKAGQVLASLDPATIATLQKALAQARVDVENAQDALAQARTADPVMLAQARVNVENARKALDQAKTSDPVQLAQAQSNIQAAQDSLDALTQPSALALSQAESALASARLSLQNAQNARQNLVDAVNADSIAKLRTALDSAETALKNAIDALAVTNSSWDPKVAAARTTLDTALSAYRGVYKKYLGIDISQQTSPGSPTALFEAYGVDLGSLLKKPAVPGPLTEIPTDNPSTPWNETTTYLWTSFYPGNLLATCDDAGALPQMTACASREFNSAWNTYVAARDSLASLQNQASTAGAAAQSAVSKASDARDQARTVLDEAVAGPDPTQLAAKDQDVALAQAKVDDARRTLARIKSPDPVQVALAQAKLKAAQDALADLEAGNEAVVALRRAQLQAAQDSLSRIEQGDLLKNALSEAALVSAKANLDVATARLDGAVLKAPFDGLVTTVNILAGQAVSSNLAAIEVVDPRKLHLSGSLDEIDILFVQKGANARVRLDALGGQAVEGVVTDVSSLGVSQSGVVTFPITIGVTPPQQVQLYEGLSATASIILQQQSNVLLIPLTAVQGSINSPTVKVAQGKDVALKSVTLGASDGFWVVVSDGLSDGDTVLAPRTQTTTSQLNTAVLRGFTGGGFGGQGGFGDQRRPPQGGQGGQQTSPQGGQGGQAPRPGGTGGDH